MPYKLYHFPLRPVFVVYNETTGEQARVEDCNNKDEAEFVAVRRKQISYKAGDKISSVKISGPQKPRPGRRDWA